MRSPLAAAWWDERMDPSDSPGGPAMTALELFRVAITHQDPADVIDEVAAIDPQVVAGVAKVLANLARAQAMWVCRGRSNYHEAIEQWNERMMDIAQAYLDEGDAERSG